MDNLPEEFYIPTIDEFCIGFEYEQNFPIWWRSNEWNRLRPENRIKELAKAGALIAAEIDRIQNIK